jgi:hypothetical protein
MLEYQSRSAVEMERPWPHPAIMIVEGLFAMLAAFASGIVGLARSEPVIAAASWALPAIVIYGLVRGIRQDEWWFMVGVGLSFGAMTVWFILLVMFPRWI